MADKKMLRLKYKKLRENLSEQFIDEMSLQIANQALKLPIWDKTYYHIFLPIPEKKEVNTDYLMHILQGKDKSIIVSKSDFTSGEMKHFLLQENTSLKISEYGIPESVTAKVFMRGFLQHPEQTPYLLEVQFLNPNLKYFLKLQTYP